MKANVRGSEGIVLRQGEKIYLKLFICNIERILQTAHSNLLCQPDFRNIHPYISPQILDSHEHILRKGKHGESIQEKDTFEINHNAPVS